MRSGLSSAAVGSWMTGRPIWLGGCALVGPKKRSSRRSSSSDSGPRNDAIAAVVIVVAEGARPESRVRPLRVAVAG